MTDRKYGQHGYRDSEKDSGGRPAGSSGPRQPGILPSRTVFRCADCGTLLPSLTDGLGQFQMPSGTACLSAVHPLCPGPAVRVHPACPGTRRRQARSQWLHVLFYPRHSGAGNVGGIRAPLTTRVAPSTISSRRAPRTATSSAHRPLIGDHPIKTPRGSGPRSIARRGRENLYPWITNR